MPAENRQTPYKSGMMHAARCAVKALPDSETSKKTGTLYGANIACQRSLPKARICFSNTGVMK